MQFVFVAGIVFLGILAQSMAGFGVALICMPLLITVLDPVSAATLVALFTLPLQIVIMWRYRHALKVRPFWRVIVGSVIGIPVGVTLITILDPKIIATALGVFVIGFALYSLLRLRLPRLRQPGWGFGFGIASGLLNGAYSAGAPPLVIYGTCLGWDSEQFKANVQALFMVSTVLTILTHVIAGNIDALVLQDFAISLPTVAVGTLIGFWLSHHIDEATFQRIVLILLLLIGVRLLLP